MELKGVSIITDKPATAEGYSFQQAGLSGQAAVMMTNDLMIVFDPAKITNRNQMREAIRAATEPCLQMVPETAGGIDER